MPFMHVLGLILFLALLLSPGGVRAQTDWVKFNNVIPGVSDTTSTDGRIPLGNNTRGDDDYVAYPSVIKDGSTYKMWYSGQNGSYWCIYYATSSNGLDWAKYDNTVPATSDTTSVNGTIPLGSSGKGDAKQAFAPFVLKDDATATYKMWYTGSDVTLYRIYHATAPIPPPAGTIFTFK